MPTMLKQKSEDHVTPKAKVLQITNMGILPQISFGTYKEQDNSQVLF